MGKNDHVTFKCSMCTNKVLTNIDISGRVSRCCNRGVYNIVSPENTKRSATIYRGATSPRGLQRPKAGIA